MDDTGYNDIGYNNRTSGVSNSSRIRTPHIDALADGGVKLGQYYAQPICTPSRAAFMTGRYPHRYGVTGYTISAVAPWGIPIAEAFLPEFLQDAGYVTACYGKWHLGFFKEQYLPSARGCDSSAGLYNAQGDHFEHVIDNGYDWQVDEKPALEFRGNYSGDLVRDHAVAFIRQRAASRAANPFFMYVAFQEAHSPFQVPQAFKDLYPELSSTPSRQALAGMVSHNDAMIGDIYDALVQTAQLPRTIIVFSADNGGPGGQEDVPRPSQFDDAVLERNWPFRGQKHEVYEGGVRVAGWVHSPLLPEALVGTTQDALFHITDWLPTLISATGASLASRAHLPLDGVDQWACLRGDATACARDEVLLNFNTVCDNVLPARGPIRSLPEQGETAAEAAEATEAAEAAEAAAQLILHTFTDDAPYYSAAPRAYNTECPAPKAALRVGSLKLLAECFDAASASFIGRLELYNVSSDPAEATDLAAALPDEVARLSARLREHGLEAIKVAPLSDAPPWQGADYFCAACPVGAPKGADKVWVPWCESPTGKPCA